MPLNTLCFTANAACFPEGRVNMDFFENLATHADFSYIHVAIERGDAEGRLHGQGVLQSRLSKYQLGRKYHFHLEKMKGTKEQNMAYISGLKRGVMVPPIDGPRTWGYWEGDRMGQIERAAETAIRLVRDEDKTEADMWRLMPNEMLRNHRNMLALIAFHAPNQSFRPKQRLTLVLHGSTGTYKSRTATAMIKEMKHDFAMLSNSDNTMWFTGYKQQRILYIEDYKGGLKYGTMLGVLDPWMNIRCTVAAGGVNTWMTSDVVIITASKPASEWYHRESSELMRRVTYQIDMDNCALPWVLVSIVCQYLLA